MKLLTLSLAALQMMQAVKIDEPNQ